MNKRCSSIVILIGVVLGTAFFWNKAHTPALNPDPNHTHADFAVFVNGTKLDFSSNHYMSTAPVTVQLFRLFPSAFAHEETGEGEHVYPGREFLHLHDGNGHVIHRHKPALTLGNFFTSIGLTMTDTCFTLDEFLFSQLDKSWVADFARTMELCSDGKFHWTMIVNGERVSFDPDFVFNDGDKILMSYGASDTAADQEYATLTDDACMYSKTCPWRGDPPVENCIADPTIPCVVQ